MRRLIQAARLLALVLLLATGAVAAPPAPPDAMTRAFQAYQKGEYDQAASLMEKHLAKNPDDATGHYAMGLIQDGRQDYEQALTHLERALQLKPDYPDARTTYAAVLQQRVYQMVDEGRLDEAVALADRAVAFQPDEPGVHFARGAVLFERWRQGEAPQDHLQALQAWNRCRELRPVSATGEILFGISAFESQDYKRAKEHFSVARVMRPKNRYAAMWLGLAEAALGEYDDALGQLREALQMFGRNPSLHRYLGDVLTLQGRYDEAEKAYREALALKPRDPRVHATLGELAVATGRLGDAVKEYREAVSQRPGDFGYAFRLAELLRDSGGIDEAMQVLERARGLASAPGYPGNAVQDQARVDLERALIMLERGQRDQAIQTFSSQEAFVSRTRTPRLYLYLAQVGPHEKRVQAIQKGLQVGGPEARQLQADLFVAWGDLQRVRGQRLDAMEMYYQAWRRTPADSARTTALRERFEATRTEEIEAVEKRQSSLAVKFLIDPLMASSQSAALDRRLAAVKKMELGAPGELAGGAGTTAQVPRSIVPAELAEGELTGNVQTAVSEGSQVRVEPSWEQKK